MGPNLVWRLSYVEPVAVTPPDVLVIAAKPGYNLMADPCGSPESLAEIGHVLQRLVQRPITLKFDRSTDTEVVPADNRTTEARRADAVSSDPMIQKVVELFEARSLQLDYGDEPASDET